jgi:hypothetical protein
MHIDTKTWVVTSYNIPSSASHQLLTWDFLQLIKYYKSPYSVLISLILNHRLRLKSILHPLIWVSNQLHFYVWRSSSVVVPSLKTPVHISHRTTSRGKNGMCHVGLSSIFKTHISSIKLWYGVSISLAY